MDKPNTKLNLKTPLTLEQVLSSYNLLILFIILFIFLVLVLFNVNRKGFNNSLGYESFVTGPILLLLAFLIKELIAFKNAPDSSWLSSFSQSKEIWFLPAVTLSIICIGIIGLFSMLSIGGIFSDNPPENNTSMIINFIAIIAFLLVTGIIYSRSKTKDEEILQTFPKAVQDVFELRTKYTVMFVAFVLAIIVLYLVNPWDIMTDYGGPIVFFTLFVGMILMIMITIYQYYLANPSKANMFKDAPTFISYLVKGSYILLALLISGALIFGSLKMMGVFDQDASNPQSWGNIFFNLLLFCGMLGIVYKLANAGGFLDKNPLYRLILNTILYIPCLLVGVINMLSQILGFKPTSSTSTFTPPNPFELKMLFLGLGLLVGYFTWFYLGKPYLRKKYLKQGGEQLVNQPIPTDILTNVRSYQSLSGNDKLDYQYAMSFWVYLNSFPPSTNSSYLKTVPILSYGENPSIKYNSKNNTFYITVKQEFDSEIHNKQNKEMEFKPEIINDWKNSKNNIESNIEKVKLMPFGNEVDADGHRIIYKHPDVLLQKWNHIVLNYNGGTLDVFYNGKLVKSAIEVVPYLKLDNLTVGSENGISGNVANLMYFKQPLDVLTIHTLYNSLKDKNPPSISDNKETLIPLSN